MEQNFRNELNQAIDFSSVLTQISAFSSFSCAKDKILNALPVFDKLEIQEQLNYAKEAIQFEQAGGLLSLSGANDISLPVSKASKQMTLTSKELISIYHFLTAVKQAKQSLDGSDYPELTNLAQSMDGCTRLMDSIISIPAAVAPVSFPLSREVTRVRLTRFLEIYRDTKRLSRMETSPIKVSGTL